MQIHFCEVAAASRPQLQAFFQLLAGLSILASEAETTTLEWMTFVVVEPMSRRVIVRLDNF